MPDPDDTGSVIAGINDGATTSGGAGDGNPPPPTLTDEVKQLLTNPDKDAILLDPSPVETAWLAALNNSVMQKAAKEAIVDGIQKLGLIDSTQFLKQSGTSANVANKIVAQIPKFTGSNPNYTWEQFMTRMHIAASSQVYSDTELKLILFQSLDGDAFAYLTANMQLMDFPFQECLIHLGQVYSRKSSRT